MELTRHQTHASLALIGFGTAGAVASNTWLAAGCFGGLGALHLYAVVELWISDQRRAHLNQRAREEALQRRFVSIGKIHIGNTGGGSAT
jgi:hypothetical protein